MVDVRSSFITNYFTACMIFLSPQIVCSTSMTLDEMLLRPTTAGRRWSI